MEESLGYGLMKYGAFLEGDIGLGVDLNLVSLIPLGLIRGASIVDPEIHPKSAGDASLHRNKHDGVECEVEEEAEEQEEEEEEEEHEMEEEEEEREEDENKKVEEEGKTMIQDGVRELAGRACLHKRRSFLPSRPRIHVPDFLGGFSTSVSGIFGRGCVWPGTIRVWNSNPAVQLSPCLFQSRWLEKDLRAPLFRPKTPHCAEWNWKGVRNINTAGNVSST
ncbi:hypothetical protein KM043_012619 [Ampulex compressa]|nr:hypothetical protein KM043_012619 [Ampulex compressa]